MEGQTVSSETVIYNVNIYQMTVKILYTRFQVIVFCQLFERLAKCHFYCPVILLEKIKWGTENQSIFAKEKLILY